MAPLRTITRSARPEKPCESCGKPFWRAYPWPQWRRTRYCSIACSKVAKRKTEAQRLWDNCIPEPNSGCWIWLGTLCANGYAQISGRTKTRRAARVSHEVHKGPIPLGKIICHTCDNRPCINPDHIYAGTHADNGADAVRRGRTLTGERNHAAKLRLVDIQKIRADQRPDQVIAEEYGVARTTISAVKHEITWRNA